MQLRMKLTSFLVPYNFVSKGASVAKLIFYEVVIHSCLKV